MSKLIPKTNETYPVWTMNRLKSRGFGRTLKHLLSTCCVKSFLPTQTSYPKILLSLPTDNTTDLCCIPDTPMTAEEWRFLCNVSGFHLFWSFSRHNTTAWSVPPVTKLVFSRGRKAMLFMTPVTWGLSSKKLTWFALCQITYIHVLHNINL